MGIEAVEQSMLHEHAPNIFTTEASDLGWPPGCFPVAFSVKGLGVEGVPFRCRGEVQEFVLYTQRLFGIEVRVFND